MGRLGLTILLCILGLCSSAVLSLSILLKFYCFSNFHRFSNFHSFLNFCFHWFPNFHSHCFLNLSLFVKISLLLTFHFHCLSKCSPSIRSTFHFHCLSKDSLSSNQYQMAASRTLLKTPICFWKRLNSRTCAAEDAVEQVYIKTFCVFPLQTLLFQKQNLKIGPNNTLEETDIEKYSKKQVRWKVCPQDKLREDPSEVCL